MYESYYGLRGKPFRLTPDPNCFFASRGHHKALAYLRYAIYRGEGFGVVAGAAGTGKTTLMRTLAAELPRNEVMVVEVVTTQLGPDDLLRVIASALDIPSEGVSKATLLKALERFLIELGMRDKRLLLLVDEAHHLSRSALEELRMLANFQLAGQALVQCFLLGQEPLWELLRAPDMEQLSQRVTVTSHLYPLSPEETRGYIEYCLHRVGWQGRHPRFSAEAYALIHRHCDGIPRRINLLCDRILLFVYLAGGGEVGAAVVEAVVQEMAQDSALELPPVPASSAIAVDLSLQGDSPSGGEQVPAPRQLPPRITELADHYLHTPGHYHGPAAGVEVLEASLEGTYGEFERLRAAALLLRQKHQAVKKRRSRDYGWRGEGVAFDSMAPVWLLIAMSVSILLTVYYLLIQRP